MKYLVLSNRHNSVYGDEWALFLGIRNIEAGYASDLRATHRFEESEIHKFDGVTDIPIPISLLEISEEYESVEAMNKHISVLIEKNTV